MKPNDYKSVFKLLNLSLCLSLSLTPVNLSHVFLSFVVSLCLFVILSVHWRHKEMNKKVKQLHTLVFRIVLYCDVTSEYDSLINICWFAKIPYNKVLKKEKMQFTVWKK